MVLAIASEIPSTACKSNSPARATALADPKCFRRARLRVAPMRGMSSRGVRLTAFARFARWAPMVERWGITAARGDLRQEAGQGCGLHARPASTLETRRNCPVAKDGQRKARALAGKVV